MPLASAQSARNELESRSVPVCLRSLKGPLPLQWSGPPSSERMIGAWGPQGAKHRDAASVSTEARACIHHLDRARRTAVDKTDFARGYPRGGLRRLRQV